MAGKGVEYGGKSGTVRSTDPEKYCSRYPRCQAYRVAGSTQCQFHGSTVAIRANAAKRAIAGELAKETGEVVDIKDVPRIVGEMVAWNVGLIRDLQRELDGQRLIGGAVDMAREMSDILDRLDKSTTSMAKLLGSVAALGIADAMKTQANAMTSAEREDRVNRLLALTLEAEGSGPMWQCPTCGRACCSVEVVDGMGS